MSPEDIGDIRTEVQILNTLSPHSTLAGIRGVYEDRDNVHIVMDYCSGGELFDRIISKGTFSEAEAARFFRAMVEMVAHCHSCHVMQLTMLILWHAISVLELSLERVKCIVPWLGPHTMLLQRC